MAANKHQVSKLNEEIVARASEQGRKLLANSPVATAARYVAGRIHVELDNGCAFEFPIAHAEGLADAKMADLRTIEIQASGLGLYWPKLDADLHVPSLVKGVLGSKQWMSQIGADGGKQATPAKAIAARLNGKRGGRPRKTTAIEVTAVSDSLT